MPVSQIYSLSPSKQPRAWLDVLASARTTANERREALQEVIILAKDKQHARAYVEDGILDSLLYMVDKYYHLSSAQSPTNGASTADPTSLQSKNTSNNPHKDAAQLAATCCLTLGKAYCAALHTEGDLRLMSLYEHGSVPEERQLAQMLSEVPHHVYNPVTKAFVMRHLSLSQALDVAATLKATAEA